MGRVARGPFLETTPYHAPEVVPLPFDLKQAAALLAEAGWADTDKDGLLDSAHPDGRRVPFEFTLLIGASSTEMATAAKIFKEDLLGIGIKMSIESVEWSLMQKRQDEKNFDAFTGAWGLYWSTDPHQIWHSSQADIPKGSNKVGFRNAKADALIEQLRVTLDPDERTRLLRDVHRIIHEEQPYSFVLVPRFGVCYRRGLEGVIYSKVRPVVDVLPWWSTHTDG
jgi:ABC-type transport system substrate-binding protein